jgi:ABC-type antimicrobial peptide transport system permease subunit
MIKDNPGVFSVAVPTIHIDGMANIMVVNRDGETEYSDQRKVVLIGYSFRKAALPPVDFTSILSKDVRDREIGSRPLDIMADRHPKDTGRALISEPFQQSIFRRPMPTGNDFVVKIKSPLAIDISGITFNARTAGSYVSNSFSLRGNQSEKIYCRLDEIKKLLREDVAPSNIDIQLVNPDETEIARPLLNRYFGETREVVTWKDAESESMFVISLLNMGIGLSVIVLSLMSFFCLTAIFHMVVSDKRKRIAVLIALGATPSLISTALTSIGFIIGAIGSIAGIAFGKISIGIASKHLGKILSSLYSKSSDDVLVNGCDVFAMIVFFTLVCALSTMISVVYALRLRPSELLHSE